jgi:hexosaminidase
MKFIMKYASNSLPIMPGPLKLKTMNRKFYLPVAMLFALMYAGCQSTSEEISIIPLPVELETTGGFYTLAPGTVVFAGDETLQFAAEYASALWMPYLGFELPASVEGNFKNMVRLVLYDDVDEEIGAEGYRLNIGRNGIEINANEPAGILYGIQTVYQLLGTHSDGKLPRMKVVDYPRFEWRGLHLDVSRHFMPIEFIYKTIDYMAIHKLNVFHWHLIDDQGWRLEIKKYPLLTEVGAWRAEYADLHWNARPEVYSVSEATYGGWYSQDEVKELVAYAAARNITVVPEIEMPAHVMSALAAYPEYSCTGKKLPVPSGGVWPITHIYCAGNDATFDFLENVLLEVMDLFPSTFIHIGGDEADKTHWKTCKKCQDRIKKEGLADEHELQSYFIQRIEKFLNHHGRRLIGWDEILEGGLAPNASVMSWRGEEGGIEAARMGHTVVMTPGSHCYFDHYQGDAAMEPLAIGGYTTLAKVYSYEPVPAQLNEEEAKLVLGAQANVWTEYMPVPSHVEYMIFPRLAALAEVLWTPANQKDWTSFTKRMTHQYERYDLLGINYSRSAFQVSAKPMLDVSARKLFVELSAELQEPVIRYTLDGTEPSPQSPLYKAPVEINQTQVLRAAVFHNERSSNQILEREYDIHKAFAAPIKMGFENSPQYDGHGEYSLVNGIRGSLSYSDGSWKGFLGNDLVAVIDLGESTSISSVTVDALQNAGSWIFLPQWVSFEVSEDGEDYVLLDLIKNEISPFEGPRLLKLFETAKPAENIRFLRVHARNLGVCPAGHSGKGQPSWMFISEIVVK